MHTLNNLREALTQKEQALIQYVRYMREAQDNEDQKMAALFSDLAKAEEKHITVIRDQVADLSGGKDALNVYQDVSNYSSQQMAPPNKSE